MDGVLHSAPLVTSGWSDDFGSPARNGALQQYDVIIVGAGPAGAATARDLAEAGIRVLVLEEHDVVGKPVQCSGLVTARALKLARVSEDVVLNRVCGAVVTSRGGRQLELGDTQMVRGLVIDRCLFDVRIAESAQEAGACLQLRARATGFERRHGRIAVRVDRRNATEWIEADVLVGADGPHSSVARWIGAPDFPEIVRVFGALVRVRRCETSRVRIHIDHELMPGWFGWAIPVDERTLRVGIGLPIQTGLSPRARLERLLEGIPGLSEPEVIEYTGGWIPLGFRERTYADNVLLVGDAAGQVKPTSGGGLYVGQVCARWCARTIQAALQNGTVDAETMAAYQQGWFGEIGPELRRQRLIRRAYRRLEEAQLEDLLRALDNTAMRAVIRSFGDIDFQSDLFSRLLAPILPLAMDFVRT